MLTAIKDKDYERAKALRKHLDSTSSSERPVYKLETVHGFGSASTNSPSTNEHAHRNSLLPQERFAAKRNQSGICVATMGRIQILSPSGKECIVTINLDDLLENGDGFPESFSLNRDGKFIAVVDRRGLCHFVHAQFGPTWVQDITHLIRESEDTNFQSESNADTIEIVQLDFTSRSGSQAEELMILTNNNCIIRFSNIDFKKIESALVSGVPSAALEAKEAIRIEKIDLSLSKMDSSAKLLAYHPGTKHALESLVAVGELVTIWSRNEEFGMTSLRDCVPVSYELNREGKIISFQIDDSGRFLFALDEETNLTVWDMKRLVQVMRFERTNMTDFLLLPKRKRNQTRADLRLMLIGIFDSSEQHNEIAFVGLPEFDTLQSFVVPKSCSLVHTSYASVNRDTKLEEDLADVLFLAKDDHSVSEELRSRSSELLLCSISETVPTHRFELLLSQCRFDEADHFAKLYGMEHELVQKARVTHMMTSLVTRSEGNHDGGGEAQEQSQILRMLESINDTAYIMSFCLSAPYVSFEFLSQLLSFAQMRLMRHDDVEGANTAISITEDSYQAAIHKQMQRLETFNVLSFDSLMTNDATDLTIDRKNGILSNSKVSRSAIRQKWEEFRDISMHMRIQSALRSGDLTTAIILWRRHSNSDNLHERIHQFLSEIPDSTPAEEFVPWIRDDVQKELNSVKDRVLLAEWVENRARTMERSQCRPHGALSVCTLLDPPRSTSNSKNYGFGFIAPTPANYVRQTIKTAETSRFSSALRACEATPREKQREENSTGVTLSLENINEADPSQSPDRILESATLLKVQLEDLVYLWDARKFQLSLNEYSRMSPSQIAIELLDREPSSELLEEQIRSHFKPYVERNKLNFDDVIVEYCVDLMDRSSGSVSDVPWEPRVLTLLASMSSFESKGLVLLEAMRRTPVPWSTLMNSAIRQALDWSSPRHSEELSSLYLHMQLKKMLVNYGVTSINLSDPAVATGMLRFVLSKTDVLHALRDALLIVEAYDHLHSHNAYVIRIRYLCQQNLIERAIRLLDNGDESLDAELEHRDNYQILDTKAKVFICEEVITWLSELMGESIGPFCVNTEDAEMMAGNAWMIRSAAVISAYVNKILSKADDSPPKSDSTGQQADPNLSAGSQSAILPSYIPQSAASVFRNILGLANGFNVYATYNQYTDTKWRTDVMNEYAARMFNYGTMDNNEERRQEGFSLAAFYRVAELLGFERPKVRSLFAEFAAQYGDFKAAMRACKEMLDRFPDSHTAHVLNNVALCATEYGACHPAAFRGGKRQRNTYRLTAQILKISQQSVCLCTLNDLTAHLDAFKAYEVLHFVFVRSDAGDYGSTVSSYLSTSNKAQPELLTTPQSSSSLFVENQLVSENLEIASLNDKFGIQLFHSYYYETGLVIKSDDAMKAVAVFVSQTLREQEKTGVKESSGASLKGKGSNYESAEFEAIDEQQAASSTLMQLLNNHRHHQLVLMAFHTSLEKIWRRDTLIRSAAGFEIYQLYNSSVEALAGNILVFRSIDCFLGVGYMLMLSMESAFASFRGSLGSAFSFGDYTRLIKIASVGKVAAIAWDQRPFLITCSELAKNAQWYAQFKLLQFPFEEAEFRKKNSEYHRTLVPDLLLKTSFDLTTALDFADDFNIESDFVLITYVKLMLLHESTQASTGVIDFVAGVIDDIENRHKLFSALFDSCLPQISPYDYEKIQFVLLKSCDINPAHEYVKRGCLVIDILQKYSRVTEPTIEELLDGKQAVSRSTFMPGLYDQTLLLKTFPQSNTRLPFHKLMETPTEVIKSELNEVTISKLLPLCPLLNLDPDQLLIIVIDNLFKTDSEKSDDQIANEAYIGSLRSLLHKLSNQQNAIEKALKMGEQFAPGMGRVSLLRIALNLAEREVHMSSKSDEPDTTGKMLLQKARHLLCISETEYQLCSHGLASLLDLAAHPKELINILFTDKYNLPQVHSLCEEIASRHGLDIDSMRLQLLQTWLLDDKIGPGSKSASDGLLPSIRLQSKEVLCPDEEILQQRLIYLLQRGDTPKSANLLMQFAYQRASKITTTHRVRALSVLFRLVTGSEFAIANQTQIFNETKDYLKVLLYLLDFEELRISQSSKDFVQCDKEALVRSLWLMQRDDIRVLQLICNICIDYNVQDVVLWENVLDCLIKQRKAQYLSHSLTAISSIPTLAALDVINRVWNYVLSDLLQPNTAKDMDDRNGAARQACHLLQICPFVNRLDKPELIKLLAKFAMSRTEPETVIDRYILVLRAFDAFAIDDSIISALTGLLETLNIDMAIRMIQAMDDTDSSPDGASLLLIKKWAKSIIWGRVVRTKSYAPAIRSAHFPAFVSYLVQKDDIRDVLTILLKARNIRQALELLNSYVAAHPNVLGGIELKVGPPEKLIMAYFEAKGFDDEVNTSFLQALFAEMDLRSA
ncbi:rough deal protein C-terminal region-domain-containing protein [Cladochytrium replicatum]|nr:rough deal protein C-terminal region-domain-containing protein [Cladochytrium replicatum]